MSSTALSFAITLTSIECGRCGGVYAINERYREKKHEEGAGWHCPYCETAWGYFRNSKIARLEKERDAAINREQWAKERMESEIRSHRATRGQLTRVKNRVKAGVCICCNRTFQNLARHMATKHPAEAAR